MIKLIAILLTISSASFASNRTAQDLEIQAELIAWYMVCESVSNNRKEMKDEAITFKKYSDIKKVEVMQYPENERSYLIEKARNKVDELYVKRFIIASCKDLYKSIRNIDNIK